MYLKYCTWWYLIYNKKELCGLGINKKKMLKEKWVTFDFASYFIKKNKKILDTPFKTTFSFSKTIKFIKNSETNKVLIIHVVQPLIFIALLKQTQPLGSTDLSLQSAACYLFPKPLILK